MEKIYGNIKGFKLLKITPALFLIFLSLNCLANDMDTAEQRMIKQMISEKHKRDLINGTDSPKSINGPVYEGYYENVYIKSDTIGVIANGPVTIKNSVIKAPICITSKGQNTRVINSTLDCNLCIEFQSSILIGNVLTNNQCSGRLTNRPDIFGR